MSNALESVTRDSDLKETYFTTPLALKAANPSADGPPPQNKWPRYNAKGAQSFGWQGNSWQNSKGGGKQSKGKGGGKAKGKNKQIHEKLQGLQLAWRTPANRDLCFAWNTGNCDGSCGRVHQCRVKGCYGDPAIKHKETVGGA